MRLIRQWRAAWDTETGASWAVVDGDRLLGRVEFRTLDLPGGPAEIAYWMLPGVRRSGVAEAAVTTLTHWAFGEIGLQRLELMHSVHNVASCAVAASTGFTLNVSVHRFWGVDLRWARRWWMRRCGRSRRRDRPASLPLSPQCASDLGER